MEPNGKMGGKPPSFYLPTMEDMGYLMQHHCLVEGGGLCATYMWTYIYVDISNCFWGFKLPGQFRDAFQLFGGSTKGGRETISILRLALNDKANTEARLLNIAIGARGKNFGPHDEWAPGTNKRGA